MIGSSVITSLIAKQFTAATFLTLAATQFRDVREIERKTLEQEEDFLLIPRGAGYIEGIAKTFEARNYLSMLVGLSASALTAWLGLIPGIIGAIFFVALGEVWMAGPVVGDVIEVRPGEIHFEKDSLLYVGDVMLMEVGLPHSRERWLQQGVGIILTPKNPRGQAVLWNLSQRQAITHVATIAVGVQKDVGYPEQTALTRMDMPEATGRAGLGLIPVDRDVERIIAAVKAAPVLEAGKWHKITSPVLVHKEMDD